MDYYGDKQPPRIYPFFKSQGSRAAPITGQTVERQSQHMTAYTGITTGILNIFNTFTADSNGLLGSFDLGKMMGGAGADDAILDWESVMIAIQQNPLPTTTAGALQFSSITAILFNNNTNGTTLWQSAPYSGVISGNPEIAADFAPQMKPLRWDAFQFIDVRTMRLQNVLLGFHITVSSPTTGGPFGFNVNSTIRYTVQNLNATALPTPVNF